MLGAITGSIAQAYYGIPAEIRQQAHPFLDKTQTDILRAFEAIFPFEPPAR